MKTEELVKIGKEYFVDIVKGGLKASLFTAFPILASPAPAYFIDAFLDWLILMIAGTPKDTSIKKSDSALAIRAENSCRQTKIITK